MDMTDKFTVAEFRDLTAEERRLLEWLVANGNDRAPTYVSQLAQVKIVSRCTCGCPTLDLAIGEKKSRTVGASTILVNAYGHSPEGIAIEVIVHAREGEISELEVYSCDGTKPFGLPTPEMLKIV